MSEQQIKVRETLENQLQLLSERSKGCDDERDLAALSGEMVKIAIVLLDWGIEYGSRLDFNNIKGLADFLAKDGR